MAILEKLFKKITFKDYPDTSTPINAQNLNAMTNAIDEIDDRVVELNSNLDTINSDFKIHAFAKVVDFLDGGGMAQWTDAIESSFIDKIDIVNATAILNSASSIIITSCTIDRTIAGTVNLRCSTLAGTPYTGSQTVNIIITYKLK